MKPVYFTPGPSELFYTVPDHLRKGLREQLFSENHRSPLFRNIFSETKAGLTELFGLPEGYRIAFLSSATEIWERIALNLIGEKGGFVVNGYFSERFANIAEQWGKSVERIEIKHGSCARSGDINFSDEIELIGITHNETSTGATHLMEDIYELRKRYPRAIIGLDIVSSAPVCDIDFSLIDTAYFSVQKGFGLPAGLGVWIYNQKCLDKAIQLEREGIQTGSYNKLTRLSEQTDQEQTTYTPNMLGIYLLGKVVEDMLQKGIDMIRRESRYKSALTYQTLKEHPHLAAFVEEESFRSQTTITVSVQESLKWIEKLRKAGIIVGSGYGIYRESQIRIANFPTHSKEQFERLADELMKLEPY